MKIDPSSKPTASERLRENKEKILRAWETRANREISAALQQTKLALRDSLPEYLDKLSDALGNPTDRAQLRQNFDLEETTRLGRKHGQDRALCVDYTIDQMIYEYHILRQVIFDVIEEEAPFSDVEREIVICSIEQAVNDAATQFSDALRVAQENLTHTIAHDLRNPIAATKMGSEMMKKKPNDVDFTLRTAGRISNSMDRLDSMIKDLLDAGLLRAGEQLPLALEKCDLDAIVREIADEFNYSFEDRFVVNSAGPMLGYWSASGLSRIIENLSTNAVKYGDPKTPITISISKNDSTVKLTVHNEGDAIPEEEQGILFQQFRRSKASKGRKEGWGLGLTLVKGITEAHHGKVSVSSVAGKGTDFSVELPLDSRTILAETKL